MEITARQFGLENTMTVQITPKSIQHTGMATSTEGSVAAWEVKFELDGDESIHTAISIPLAGPPTHHEAREKALKILQVFLKDACEAARKYQFSN
jgi:polyisoprenoid-binding protein YceI